MPAELPKKTADIRKIYNPEDDEKKTIDFVYTRKREMESSEMRKTAERQWDQSDKQWEAMREPKKQDEWQSNHYVPLTQANVETALAEFVNQVPHPFILPRGTEDIPKARIMNLLYDYTREISNQDMTEYDVLKDALIRGTAIGQEYYWKENLMVQETSMDSKGNAETSERQVVDYDDCNLEIVKLEDFLVDEFARGFSGPYAARDCIRRYIMNIDDFKVMFTGDQWDPFNNAQYVKAGGDVNYYEYYQPPKGIDTTKQVEVLWYWARKPKDWLIIVANDVLIKKGPNPYKHKQLPFVRAIAVKRPHSFYGKGLAEILESTQDETNTIRRMTIDRSHLDIDKMFFVSSRLSLDDSDLIARPHGMIPVDDVNASKAIDYDDVPRSVEIALNHLEDDAVISTGVNPRAESLPQAGTATEAAILKESTLKRLNLILWLLKNEFLLPHAKLRIANIIQFYQEPRLEKIVGDAATSDYKAEVARLKAKGYLVQDGKNLYKKSYRSVRLDNQQIQTDTSGNPVISSSDNVTFFEAEPKYFVPECSNTYDVKFLVGSDLQISKSLLRSQMLELSDRLMQVAFTVQGSYDPVKIMDEVIRMYDKDPATMKPDQPQQDQQDQKLQVIINLAGMENKQMMQGVVVPSTPYAPPAHTQIHTAFMNSKQFQASATPAIVKVFTDHVMGELMAQHARNVGPNGELLAQGDQNSPQPVPQNTPAGPTTQTSVSQGIQNRPGGMAKGSTNRLANILPQLNNGQGTMQ